MHLKMINSIDYSHFVHFIKLPLKRNVKCADMP